MAAQEYYHPNSPAPRPAGPYSGAQGYAQSPAGYGPPPPYTEMAPAQPPPQPQYRPDDKQHNGQRQPQGYNYNYNQSQYPPAAPAQTYYRYHYPDPPPTQYPTQQQYYYPQQQQQYPQQYAKPVYASGALAQAGNVRPHSQPPPNQVGSDYRRESRSGSRHRHDHHHRHHSSDRRHGSEKEAKKKGRLNTFVGAGGGALIGDAIFPGLGTVGGALLGGLGGHKVAEEKRRRSVGDQKIRRDRSRGHYDDEDERIGRRRY